MDKMSKEDKAREQKWETEQDLDAFRRVAEVKKDKARVARVKAAIKDQMASLKDIET